MRWSITAVLAVVLGVGVTACSQSKAAPGGSAAPAPPTAAEREQYDRYRRPDLLLAALALRPGAVVADVGAGRGYLTARLALAVGAGGEGKGKVVATDIDAAALAAIAPAGPGAAPVETRVVEPDDPGLEPATYDLILLAEVDHLLPERAAYLRRLAVALAPGGRIAVSNRPLYRAPLLEAATRAGLHVASESRDLPAHFLVVLTPETP